MYDITLLTDARYVNPKEEEMTDYVKNILLEASLLKTALEKQGLKVHRTHWDNPDFDWSSTKTAIFRTTWDYFDRFDEFAPWLEKVTLQTQLINPASLLHWSLDKHYLLDLKAKGIHIPETLFIEKGDARTLSDWVAASGWQELILKPAVSGAARHTYRFTAEQTANYEDIYQSLIAEEAMLLQVFQQNVLERGEVAFMVFGGQYSHAILKRAKAGDFRVQDDFGGTVHPYQASAEEKAWVEKVIAAVDPLPAYARVDMIWDNDGQMAVSELELVEPELWFREAEHAAELLASYLKKEYF